MTDPPAGPADRHEPMPGLLGLPGYLLRKLSPRGQRVAAVLGALLLVVVVVGAIVLVPVITESKREGEAEERRDRARAAAAERARLAAEQRPRTGTLEASGTPALVAGTERAITRDAGARVASGELKTPVRETRCRRLGRDGARLALGCTAVTTAAEAVEGSSAVLSGYPYRATVAADGRYALCKISGRPGEGLYTRLPPVKLPAACGGAAPAAEGAVRRAVEGLYAAAAAQDGAAMCRLLAPSWRARLERRPPPCPAEALSAVLGPGPPRNLRVGEVEVDGPAVTASATAARGHGAAERQYAYTLELVQSGQRWLVAAAKEAD